MFISQLTSTSDFGELHFGEKLLTAASATKKGGHSFYITGQIWKHFTHIKFLKVYRIVFRIFLFGVHVSLQFNEYHLAGLSFTGKSKC